MKLFSADLSRVFAPDTPLLELVARGTVLYLALLILMRVMLRRSSGDLAMMDLIFLLLLAEAAAHSLGDYTSVADGLVVIVTLVVWDYLTNFLSYHVPFVEKFVSPPPLQVVRDGRLLRRNMRREFLTEEELTHQLRRREVEELKDVKAAYVESDGSITVISDKGNR